MKTDAQLQKDVMDELKWEPITTASQIGVSASKGVVTLNGQTVPLDTDGGPDEGWRLKNASTIELLGSACKTLKETPNATLKARFPCNAVQDLPR